MESTKGVEKSSKYEPQYWLLVEKEEEGENNEKGLFHKVENKIEECKKSIFGLQKGLWSQMTEEKEKGEKELKEIEEWGKKGN